MSRVALLTPQHYPPELRAYIQSLAPLPTPQPPAAESLLRTPARTQWYERVGGAERLQYEVRELTAQGHAASLVLTKEGANRSIVLRGCIPYKPLLWNNVPTFRAYTYFLWVPPDYPHHHPNIYFCWERVIHSTTRSPRGPFRMTEGPYQPPGIHHYSDGKACITKLHAEAQQYGVTGWEPARHTLAVFLGWSLRYIANLEGYRHNGQWPDDDKR